MLKQYTSEKLEHQYVESIRTAQDLFITMLNLVRT